MLKWNNFFFFFYQLCIIVGHHTKLWYTQITNIQYIICLHYITDVVIISIFYNYNCLICNEAYTRVFVRCFSEHLQKMWIHEMKRKKKSTSKDDNSIVYLVYHSIVMIDRRWMKRENYPVLENVQHMTGRAIVGV